MATNNTSKTPAEYMKKIAGANIHVEPDQILTPLITLEEYIREKGYKSVYLVASDAVVKHMDGGRYHQGIHRLDYRYKLRKGRHSSFYISRVLCARYSRHSYRQSSHYLF